jgi:hypothetical protein
MSINYHEEKAYRDLKRGLISEEEYKDILNKIKEARKK